uniref:Uncharacterized protein n=1 Tax=Octopus bimaculoides TaxID=37653 RepID=A0A0L8I9M1_OCTBM
MTFYSHKPLQFQIGKMAVLAGNLLLSIMIIITSMKLRVAIKYNTTAILYHST